MQILGLQKPEESIRRPNTIDDEFLLSETDNTARLTKAEITPKTVVGTLNAIASQIRQMNWGTTAGKNWPDIPPVYLSDVANLIANLGTTTWTAGENITAGQVVYATPTAGETKVAAHTISASQSVIGIAKDTVTTGESVRILHSGYIITGLSGLTPGNIYYLNSNGSVSLTVPTGAGTLVLKIGIARSSTELLIDIGEPRLRA